MSDSHHSNSFLGFDSLRSNRTRHHFPRQSSILFHKGLKKMILALILPSLLALSLPSSAYSSFSSSNTINCPPGSKHCSGKNSYRKKYTYYILYISNFRPHITSFSSLSISNFLSHFSFLFSSVTSFYFSLFPNIFCSSRGPSDFFCIKLAFLNFKPEQEEYHFLNPDESRERDRERGEREREREKKRIL